MELIAFWFIGAIVVAIIADVRGRSGFGWFILSCLFSPLLMGILLLALGSGGPKFRDASTGEAITPDTHVRCPECRELVRADARKCKHCGEVLVPREIS